MAPFDLGAAAMIVLAAIAGGVLYFAVRALFRRVPRQ